MRMPANMHDYDGTFCVIGAERMAAAVILADAEGAWSWRPADVFTVDGIRYNDQRRGLGAIQPMILVKPVHLDKWDSPHHASTRMFAVTRHETSIWAGLKWDPDITF